MHEVIAMPLTLMADSSSAETVMRSFVSPVISTMCVFAGLVCAFFLVNGGYVYMTSTGRPENLDHAKRVIKNALLGLLLVLAAATLTEILTHAYSASSVAANARLPQLTAVTPQPVSNGLVDVLIKAITGLLNNIIQSIAEPFLKALSFFTTSTPLMAANSSVFNLWLAMVGITDALFVLVVALLGFHVMGASTFGFEEIEFKHLLPRLGLIFLLMNVSIFAIDGVIELSNAMIRAVNAITGASSVWTTLTNVVKQTGGQGVAALLIMVAFLIFSAFLLVYYVGRIVALYIGAVMSPIVLVLWLIPGFRDFSETAAKVYLTTIFVLFVHVVILLLAASLFAGMAIGSPTHTPDTLMAMITGLATLIALLKTQGLLMQWSYVTLGPKSARKLGGQFITGVSYLNKGRKVVTKSVSNHNNSQSQPEKTAGGGKRPQGENQQYTQPKSNPSNTNTQSKSSSRAQTGTTTVAPKVDTAKPSKEMEKP
jgi:hypothetical protein